MNLKPVLASAGWIVRVTGNPEWTPTPTRWCDRAAWSARRLSWSRPTSARRSNLDAADHADDVGRTPAVAKLKIAAGKMFGCAVPPTRTPLQCNLTLGRR